ncbi:MAG: phosphotyrosine protein phosphatase [Pseudomonadota bacterium]
MATAEHVFAGIGGVETLSAGTNRGAEEPISADLVEWADIIFVMERLHRQKILRSYRQASKNKRIVVLGIPDRYQFMEPRLVSILQTRMKRWLP